MEELKKSIEEVNAKAEQINANEVAVKAATEKAESLAVELKSTKDELVKFSTEVEKMKADNVAKKSESVTHIAEYLEEKEFKFDGKKLAVKASLDFSNLTDNNVFAQVESGISYQPYVTPRLVNLFPHITLTTETYSYVDQTAVTRNSQNIALCATGTSFTTSEDLTAELVNYVEIKDSVQVCNRYAEDYNFVGQSASFLINTALVDKVEAQIVNGTGTSNQMFSLETYSSEFSAANVEAPVNDKVEKANFADVLLSMAMQIEVLGKLGHFMPNVAVVNRADFFTQVESAKDTQGQYLDPRFRIVNGVTYVGNLMIVPSTKVAANSCYVMDTTKGNILDRNTISVKSSSEHGTNFVDGFTTLLGVVDLQFLVRKAEQNAFMKCSDIAAAIIALDPAKP